MRKRTLIRSSCKWWFLVVLVAAATTGHAFLLHRGRRAAAPPVVLPVKTPRPRPSTSSSSSGPCCRYNHLPLSSRSACACSGATPSSSTTVLLAAVSSSSSSSTPMDAANATFRDVVGGGNRHRDEEQQPSSPPRSLLPRQTNEKNGEARYRWTRPTLALAVPALIGMLADPILSLVDTAYVGRVGTLELAALGSCTSIFHLAFNAFRATTAATTSLVANALPVSLSTDPAVSPTDDDDDRTSETNNATAAKFIIDAGDRAVVMSASSPSSTIELSSSPPRKGYDEDAAKQVSWLSLQLGFWMGMTVLAGLVGGGRFALACMGVPHDSPLFRPASEYLYARCWAAPIVLLITVSEGVFRGYGNTVVPLVASLTAAGMNLVLDPVLMFRPVHWGVAGAAAATAVSQCGAAAVYAWNLIRRDMLPRNVLSFLGAAPKPSKRTTPSPSPDAIEDGRHLLSAQPGPRTSAFSNRRAVIRAILVANLSMMIKQGSLLLGWAFATARATRLGPRHVAAHQVALSVWLVFALILDGAAVASQVLMSRAVAANDRDQVASLTAYMVKFALVQGGLSMLILSGLDQAVPHIFTPDRSIQALLHTVMPHLAAQQVLVSLTLVVESLAAGANQFGILAVGTALSTAAAIWQIGLQSSVDGIWSLGITTLFAGRLVTAVAACCRAIRIQR